MPEETKYLIVYGSLMRRFEHPMYKILEDNAKFIANGSFQGKLYRIDWYPGAVKSNNPEDAVFGEIYELNNHEQMLTELDVFESFDPRNLEGSEFVRESIQVKAEDGSVYDCEAYLFNHSVERAKHIESGRFLSL